MQLLGSDGNSRIFKIKKRNINFRYVLSSKWYIKLYFIFRYILEKFKY